MKPHGRLIGFVLALAGLGAGVILVPALVTVWFVACGLLLTVSVVDLLACLTHSAPTIERKLPGSLSLASWSRFGVND